MAMTPADLKTLLLFSTEICFYKTGYLNKPYILLGSHLVSTKMGSQRKPLLAWLQNARSTQTPVGSNSVGCGLCSLYDVKLFQVMRFQIFMRMRGEMLVLREDDIIILIGVIALFKVLRQCFQQD